MAGGGTGRALRSFQPQTTLGFSVLEQKQQHRGLGLCVSETGSVQKHTGVRKGSKSWALCALLTFAAILLLKCFGPCLHWPLLFQSRTWCWTQIEERSHEMSPGTTGCSIICLSCSSRWFFSPCQVKWIKQEELLRSLPICSLSWKTPRKYFQAGELLQRAFSVCEDGESRMWHLPGAPRCSCGSEDD